MKRVHEEEAEQRMAKARRTGQMFRDLHQQAEDVVWATRNSAAIRLAWQLSELRTQADLSEWEVAESEARAAERWHDKHLADRIAEECLAVSTNDETPSNKPGVPWNLDPTKLLILATGLVILSVTLGGCG